MVKSILHIVSPIQASKVGFRTSITAKFRIFTENAAPITKMIKFADVWFQKMSRPLPRREWKFQGGGGVRGPGNSRGEGGWTIKSLSGGKYHFIFDLSSNIASYRTVRSFLEHK